MDIAVIEYGNEKGFSEVTEIYERVDEIPFDFTRRRMSVVVESENGKRQLITKGAVEEMISICSFVEVNGEVLPLNEELIKTVMNMVTKLNEDGMRVLAIAQKKIMYQMKICLALKMKVIWSLLDIWVFRSSKGFSSLCNKGIT